MTTAPQPRRRAPRWRRLAIDILLLPPALLYVLVENLFWFTATRLLHHAARIRLLQTLQHAMQKSPPAAILILFLIPKILSKRMVGCKEHPILRLLLQKKNCLPTCFAPRRVGR